MRFHIYKWDNNIIKKDIINIINQENKLKIKKPKIKI